MNILIAVPAYGSEVKDGCATSMFRVGQLFSRLNIPTTVRTISAADVVLARNLYGALMLAQNYTHVLFIDSDMEFRPSAIQRMLNARTPFIGVVYPKKSLDLNKFYESSKTMTIPQALSSAMQFAVHTSQHQLTLKDGIGSVDYIGLGLSLIERKVFADLASNPSIRREPPNAGRAVYGGMLYGLFDQFVTPAGTLVPEDYSFCHRWRTLCGGEIRAIFDEEVSHHGNFAFSGKFPGVR